MKNFLLLIIVSCSFIACKKEDDDGSHSGSHSQHTQSVNLQIDGFTTGAVAFQSSFIAGDAAAVTLGPVSNTFKVSYVKFLLGGTGSAETKPIDLKIYLDEGNTDPDSLLFSSSYMITSSEDILQEIDLRSENIVITGGGSIRISLDTGNGLPSVAVDTDGTIDTQHNWIYSGGSWNTSANYGVANDFIIRAVVEENI